MLQQSLEPANVTNNVSAQQRDHLRDIEERFAEHRIEPELMQARPRNVRRGFVGRDVIHAVAIPMYCLMIGDAFIASRYPTFVAWFIGFVAVAGLSFGVGSWLSETRQAMRRKKLLEHGDAVPAVIIAIDEARWGKHVEFAYRTPRGDVLFSALVVSASDLPQSATVGSSITALVAPQEERQVMRYFLRGEYRVD